MAVLGITSLTGCNSIPSFIATGSRMVFEQIPAPNSWTKETNAAFNDVALRVVTGPAGSGPPAGGIPFSRPALEGPSVFPNSPRGLAAVPFSGPSQLNISPSGSILTLGSSPSNVSGGVSSGDMMAIPEMRIHSHTYQRRGDTENQRGSASTQNTPLLPNASYTTVSEGQGGSHNHTISDQTHSHAIGTGDHDHTVTEASHSHQFIMTARDFRLLYMDVIICTKD